MKLSESIEEYGLDMPGYVYEYIRSGIVTLEAENEALRHLANRRGEALETLDIIADVAKGRDNWPQSKYGGILEDIEAMARAALLTEESDD